jgi:hypothetical protein
MRLRTVALIVLTAFVIHTGLAWYLASGDVLAALIVRRDPGTGLALVVLLVLRVCLIGIAPGWLLYAGLVAGWRRLRGSGPAP